MQSRLSFRLHSFNFRTAVGNLHIEVVGPSLKDMCRTWFLRVIRAVSFGTNSAEVRVFRREPEFQKRNGNTQSLLDALPAEINMLPRTMGRRAP